MSSRFKEYKPSVYNPYVTNVAVGDAYVDGEYDLFRLLNINTKDFNPNPMGFINGEDCAVRAICALLYMGVRPITEDDWNQVYQELSEVGRKQGRIINHIWVIADYLKDKGYDMANPQVGVSLGTFMCSHRIGRYIISCGPHVFAYIDGTIYDLVTMFEHIESMMGHYLDVVYCGKDETRVLLK